MMRSAVKNKLNPRLDSDLYHEELNLIIRSLLSKFDCLTKRAFFFNFFFFILAIAEFCLFSFFFSFFAESSLMSIVLSAIFFTFFSYVILRIYFQAKKPEQLNEIKDLFLQEIQTLLQFEEGTAEFHIAMASCCCQLAESLDGREARYYILPKFLSFFSPYLERFSCWLHGQDVDYLKEVALIASVEQHIQLVKCEATNLQSHISLANAYVMLSGLYVDPRKLQEDDEERSVSVEKYSKTKELKFRAVAERAIEEFKILCDYAPNDPWIHEQLAYTYRDLQMPLEEIREYELLLNLNPSDTEALYKLGVLYFQLGRNAQGLQIYEQMKHFNYKKAEALIKYYGAYSLSQQFLPG